MGTFTVTRSGYAPALQARLRERHLNNGFEEEAAHSFGDWTLRFYTRPGRHNSIFLDLGSEGFIGITGSLIYASLTGEEAARKLYDSFDGKSVDWRNALGSYSVILKKAGRVFIFTDRLGLAKIYQNTIGTCLSSSFISILDQLEQSTPDPVGCHMYAWLELIYGDRTFVNEIKPAPPNSLIEVGPQFHVRQLETPIERKLDDWNLDFEDSVDFYVERLQKLFAVYAKQFDGRINSSLSGGFDSRLVLALLLDAGIKPRTYVYGEAADPDVQVAKDLARVAGLKIDWVNKSERLLPAPDEWPKQLSEQCFALDGWTNIGIVNGGNSDLETRFSRSQGDQVLLLGTAGEIFRNFFYLPERSYDLEKFVRAIYFRLDPAACGPQFSAGDYTAALVGDIQQVLGVQKNVLERHELEMVYPLLRARYFFGRDMVINARFGWSFSPFLEPEIFEGTQNVPLKFKNMGHLERRIIHRINPELAACQSAYGYPFDAEPPLAARLKYYLLDHYRPLWVRGYSYRLQHRRPATMPSILKGDYLKAIIDPEFPFLRNMFNIERVYDAEVMNRIVTMEYLLQQGNGGK